MLHDQRHRAWSSLVKIAASWLALAGGSLLAQVPTGEGRETAPDIPIVFVPGTSGSYLKFGVGSIYWLVSTSLLGEVPSRGVLNPEGNDAGVEALQPGEILDSVNFVPPSSVMAEPGGFKVKGYFGGRDDAFFNDLPGFFRSINYAPQFYHVPLAMKDARELPIPKTLIELEGNTLFNFNPEDPRHDQGVKHDLPRGPLTWSGNTFKKDQKGNYRFVYSGRDAQAGRNVNAIIVEIPLAYITKSPETDRIVNAWGESWVRKASHKVPAIPDNRANLLDRVEHLIGAPEFEDEIRQYKLVDTDGQPFADAALNEREDERQLGANNIRLARHFVLRLAHLGWGFGPSITAMGLRSAFDHDNAPVSVHRTYTLATLAFPRVQKVIWQELNMPDDSWNKSGKTIPLKRAFEIEMRP